MICVSIKILVVLRLLSSAVESSLKFWPDMSSFPSTYYERCWVKSNNKIKQIGTGDWTFQMWWRTNTGGSSTYHTYMFCNKNSSNPTSGVCIQANQQVLPTIILYTSVGEIELPDVTVAGNTWHHFVFKKSGNTVSMYVNGVEESTVTNSSLGSHQFHTSIAPEWGVDPSDSTTFGLFTVGHYALWKRSLTNSEISLLKDYMLNGISSLFNDEDLLHYWPMNDGSGTTVKDMKNPDGTYDAIRGTTQNFNANDGSGPEWQGSSVNPVFSTFAPTPPSKTPTLAPSKFPSDAPSMEPTHPSASPTQVPTINPILAPSNVCFLFISPHV